jgi:hypothetical protein
VANNRSVKIAPAFGGMDSESSPEYVGPTKAAVLENLLPRPGKVVLRGPISDGIDLLTTGYNYIEGAMVHGSNIFMRSAADSRYIDEETVDPSATVTVGTRFCTLGAYAYGTGGPTADLRRWNGATTVVGLTNGPTSPIDVTTHLSRLFTIDRDNNLSWSDQGGSPANLTAEWSDDVSGLTNLIVVGDSNDRARGLGHVGKQLAILKDRSIWLLAGLTPSSFSVQRITNEWGCVSRESIVDLNDGVFFLSERGMAFHDGAQTVDVSGDIQSELLAAIRGAGLPLDEAVGGTSRMWGGGTVGASVPFARAASIGRNCIMLTIGIENTSSAVTPTILFCGIYDTKQGTWSKFSSDAFALGAPVYFIPTPPSSFYAGATLGYDGVGTLLYLDDLVAPESSSSALGGKDTVDGTTEAIPAATYSRIIPLSSPTNTSQLERLHFEYSFVVVADAADSVDAWEVSLVDGQGNVLLAPTSVQATVLASGYTTAQRQAALIRKRFQTDVFTNTAEVQLRITLPALDAAVTEVVAAEIHDSTIEFAPGRDRPTS